MHSGRKLLVIALAGLAGLGLAEAGVRWMGLAPVPPPEYSGEVLVPSTSSALGFENRPGGELVMSSRPARGAPQRVVVATVNAQGFRGPLVEQPKPAGTLRIACLGDSHTFGHGVPEGESWPDHLRELLRARHPQARIEVMNCGVNAYNTLQEVHYLGERIMPFEPDLVLLQYHLNDAAEREVAAGEEAEVGWVLRWTAPRRTGFVRTLRRTSAFLDLGCDWAFRRASLATQSEAHRERYSDAAPGWKQVQGALGAATQRLGSRGVPFGVLLYPYLVRVDGRYLSHDAFERVKAVCAGFGTPCLDPSPAMLRHPDAELHVHPSDVHGNALANRILAEEALGWLEREGLLQRSFERLR